MHAAITDVEGAALDLHDAFLTLSSIRLERGRLQLVGHQVLPDGWRTAKYRVSLVVLGVREYAVLDEAEVDQIDVADMERTPDGFVIRGHMPVEVRVSTSSREIHVTRSERPFATLWFFKWRGREWPQ